MNDAWNERNENRWRLVAVLAAWTLASACGTARDHRPDGGSPVDGGHDPCVEARATIGPEGGTLTLCDATLVVPRGALEEPLDLRIERVDSPPDLPEPFVIVGHAWRFSPAVIPDIGVVEIRLAHASERPLELARFADDAWVAFGACEQTETTLTQKAWWELGTFAAITDGRDLPADPVGIGSATADVELGDRTLALETGASGYLTREVSLGSIRTFALHAVADTVELSLEIALDDADGTAVTTFILLTDSATGEQWTVDVFSNPDALETEVDEGTEGLTASVIGTLTDGTHERSVTLSMAGTPGPWWREPPRLCIGPAARP